ncbi:PmeII family type II restriction endonuclease [Cysteiniphilum sp. 19S12-1]|uniref:PmeII family type II restriction endonuclease n=1 Tax=Cysteiniphilum sp. 19S12-1 TaxID=3453130 RepID=UPI003F844D47
MLDAKQKELILQRAKAWFKETIALNHRNKTMTLDKPESFNINPFIIKYLANFLTGKSDALGIAKALVYPRVLGTSITTIFGNGIQSFSSSVFEGVLGSTTQGIDIEYIDAIDRRKKYCQLKSGPSTINKDDVDTIANKFKAIINLGRTNNLQITHNDMVVGVIYGNKDDLSANYRNIELKHHYPVLIGQEFWYRITGDKNFYYDLANVVGSVAIDCNFSNELDDIIKGLSEHPEIQSLAK